MGDNINTLGTVSVGGVCKMVTQPQLITVTAIKRKFLEQLPKRTFEDGLRDLKIIGIVESYKVVAKDPAYGMVWTHVNDYKSFLITNFMADGDVWVDAGTHADGIIGGITQLFAD